MLSSAPRHMRGNRQPNPALPRPDIGIAAEFGCAIGGLVGGARMDDRRVAKQADYDIARLKPGDRHRDGGLFEEARPVDQRTVGVRAIELGARISSKRPTSQFCTDEM